MEVDTDNPTRESFTDETFIEVGQTIAIVLLLTSGQRPEVIEWLSTSDIHGLTVNPADPRLFTLCVQQFTSEKKGKTKSEIRLGLDCALVSLVFFYQAMRSKSVYIQTVLFYQSIYCPS